MIVLLLIADSVRHDAPAFAGGPSRTPNLDRLAREGTVFTHAIASAGWTVPSMVSLTTGTFAHRVGVARWRHPFPRRRPTLMTAFAGAGFEVRTLVHNPRFCLANAGFRGEAGDSEIPAEVVAALDAPRGVDRFVLVQHWWTHLPYRQEFIPRTPWRKLCDEAIGELGARHESSEPRLRSEYHDALSYFDRELLPKYLEAAARSGQEVLVCFTADHGENWGSALPEDARVQHMYDLHGRWLTDETTRVPLVFWGKDVPARRVEGLARGVDVAPTLCAMAGVPWPGPIPSHDPPTCTERGIGEDGTGLELDGRSLAPSVLYGQETRVAEALTVTSHNAVRPPRYPRTGRRMWCRFGLRTATDRWQWDGQYGFRDHVSIGEAPPRKLLSRLRSPDRSTWALCARERKQGIGPAKLLEKSVFPRFERPGRADDEDGGLEAPMRLLGYVD